MTRKEPVAELEPHFSGDDATATPWGTAREQLEQAQVYWLSTVRPDGRPHVTPLLALWLGGVLYFSTGASERKAKNLVGNAHCVLTTGCNSLDKGLDLVVEGDAVRVSDTPLLQRVADAYQAKYGSDWHYTVQDDTIQGGNGNIALVYAVTPTTVFGFGKGTPFSQTRWRF